MLSKEIETQIIQVELGYTEPTAGGLLGKGCSPVVNLLMRQFIGKFSVKKAA